ncbi:MAG: 6-phospho-3-hexuloisomerase [Eubacteriales bacterium]
MKYTDTILNEIEQVIRQLKDEDVVALTEGIRRSKKIFVAGLGRSGLMIKSFAMRLMHIGFDVYVVGETVTPGIEQGDILIIGSGSGETSSLVSMASKAKSIGAKIALVTTNKQSGIAKIADTGIELKAQSKEDASDVSTIQPMGSLFEQSLLILFDAVILELMDVMRKNGNTMFKRHANLE